MSDTKLLTVVVAAYNCSTTLDRIFEHIIVCKHLDQLEVIIVNDGSKDDTSVVAHRLADKYPSWVRVIDKENGGHGSALSAGFKAAQGRYCRPLDGDDWLDEYGLDALMERLASCNADMVVSDVKILNLDSGDAKKVSSPLPSNRVCEVADIIPIEPMPGYHATIFSTRILQRIPEFDHHCFYVDNEYNTYPLFYVDEIIYYPENVYVHTVGNEEQSTSVQSLIKNIGNLKTVFFSLMQYAEQHEDKTDAVAVTHRFAGSLLGTFTNVAFVEDAAKGKAELHAMYAEVRNRYPAFYRSKYVKPLGRIYRALHLHGYSCIRLLVRVKNKGNARIVW